MWLGWGGGCVLFDFNEIAGSDLEIYVCEW